MCYKPMRINELVVKAIANPARTLAPKSARKHKNLQKKGQLVNFVGYLKPMIN